MGLQDTILVECQRRYDVLVGQINQLYQGLVKPEERATITFQLIMGQVDIYLQSILLGIALSDKNVSDEEIELIDKVTKYSNIFVNSKIDIKKTNFNGFLMKMQMQKVATQNSVNAIPAIFHSMAEVDKKTNLDYFSTVAPSFVEILIFFMATDGSVSEQEKKKIRELTAPLFKLFPNSKSKL